MQIYTPQFQTVKPNFLGQPFFLHLFVKWHIFVDTIMVHYAEAHIHLLGSEKHALVKKNG